MALKKRIIVTALFDGKTGNCIKPKQFKRDPDNFRIVGDIVSRTRLLAARNIDELVLCDATATEQGREPNFSLLREITGSMTCPVTFGGGISKVGHVREALNSGADKIILRSAVANSNSDTHMVRVVNDVSKYIGKQSTVVALDICCANCMMNEMMLLAQLMKVMDVAGVGEFILTTTYDDGMMKGYSLFNAMFAAACPYNTVLNGGCGQKEHMAIAFEYGVQACAASSMFLFTETTPRDCAEYCVSKGIDVRLDPIIPAIPRVQ